MAGFFTKLVKQIGFIPRWTETTMKSVRVHNLRYEFIKEGDFWTKSLYGEVHEFDGIKDGTTVRISIPKDYDEKNDFFITSSGRIWEIWDWMPGTIEEFKKDVGFCGYRRYSFCGKIPIFEERWPNCDHVEEVSNVV